MIDAHRSTYPCPWCDWQVDIRYGKQVLAPFVPAGEHAQQLVARGVDRGRGDKVVTGLTTVGGYGWAPAAGTRISLAICPEHLAIAAVPNGRPDPIIVPFDLLVDFEFQGGATRKGQMVIGGGSGISGALTGVIVASVLNSLMSKSQVNTVLRISAADGELFAHHGSLLPNDLRTILAPAVNSVTARRGAAVAPVPAAGDSRPDLLSRLERLAALRSEGVLTDAEFQVAKGRILEGQ
jgi:hypothetical protein